jgi:hypothetical protein
MTWTDELLFAFIPWDRTAEMRANWRKHSHIAVATGQNINRLFGNNFPPGVALFDFDDAFNRRGH